MYGAVAAALANGVKVKAIAMPPRLVVCIRNARTGERADVQARMEFDDDEFRLTKQGAEQLLVAGANLWSHGWEREEMEVISVTKVVE